MTNTPRAARGVVDADTGDVLVVTRNAITWVRAAGPAVNVTPEFVWTCVAAGGGSIAVAGPDSVEWHGPAGSVLTRSAPDEEIYRLAVSETNLAAVSRSGLLSSWRSLNAQALTVELNFAPDGIALDTDGSRIAGWGWDGLGSSTMTVLDLAGRPLVAGTPAAGWPAADSGVAMGLAEGMIAVGGTDSLLVFSSDGRQRASLELAGLERLTGSAEGLGWIRSLGENEIVAGIGRLRNTGRQLTIDVITELPVPHLDTDPFPEFALADGGDLLLTAGLGPRRLAVCRMAESGWSESIAVF